MVTTLVTAKKKSRDQRNSGPESKEACVGAAGGGWAETRFSATLGARHLSGRGLKSVSIATPFSFPLLFSRVRLRFPEAADVGRCHCSDG